MNMYALIAYHIVEMNFLDSSNLNAVTFFLCCSRSQLQHVNSRSSTTFLLRFANGLYTAQTLGWGDLGTE